MLAATESVAASRKPPRHDGSSANRKSRIALPTNESELIPRTVSLCLLTPLLWTRQGEASKRRRRHREGE